MRDFATLLRPVSSRMRLIATTITLLAFLSVGASAQYYSCTVYTPYAGQSFTQGTDCYIQWEFGYNPGWVYNRIGIDISSNGGASWFNLASNLNGYTTTYTWAIPLTQTPGTNYYVRVYEQAYWYSPYNSDGYGGAFTIARACTTPIISVHPKPATVCAGIAYTFTVTSDMLSGTYQWKKDNVIVATTTTPSYTINPVAVSHAGSYSVTLTDPCGVNKTATSNGAPLVVNIPPSITKHPQPTVTICQSGRDTLKAGGIGIGRTFQWQKDGVNIPFATDSNYVVDNAQLTSQGSYRLVVSGTCSPSAVTNASVVSVVVRPAMTTEPTSLALCPGSSGQLSVVATGVSLSYQWYRNNVAIAGTGSTLPFTNYSYAQDGQYYVVVTSTVPNPNNCAVKVNSAIVTVTGYRAPSGCFRFKRVYRSPLYMIRMLPCPMPRGIASAATSHCLDTYCP